jgi:DNA-binding NarL/FixJ family response regulator
VNGSPSAERIRVFVLDDHEIVRRGIMRVLERDSSLLVVGEASTVAEARLRIPATRPHVALLDARLADGSGIELCDELRVLQPEARCVILTSYEDDDAIFAAVMAGAQGYLLKTVRGTNLTEAVRNVAGGMSLLDPAVTASVLRRVRGETSEDPRLAGLTDRERLILARIAEGRSNREIANELFLAEKTVKNRVTALLQKLGVESRTQAALIAADARRN